jgi:hypothetical protein
MVAAVSVWQGLLGIAVVVLPTGLELYAWDAATWWHKPVEKDRRNGI